MGGNWRRGAGARIVVVEEDLKDGTCWLSEETFGYGRTHVHEKSNMLAVSAAMPQAMAKNFGHGWNQTELSREVATMQSIRVHHRHVV